MEWRDNNEVRVDTPVDWDNGGNGYPFTCEQPIFNSMEAGAQITANSESRYITAVTDNFTATVDQEVDWNNSGYGYDFAFKMPPLQIDDGSDSRMIVKPDGKVGIGAADPGEKLEVNGNIKASGGVAAGTAHITPSTSNMIKWEIIEKNDLGDGSQVRYIDVDNVTSANFIGMQVFLESDSTQNRWYPQGNNGGNGKYDIAFEGQNSPPQVSIGNRDSDVNEGNKKVKIILWYFA
ncbi:MAG: hypothetical protein JW913_13350 [Chitinispirillaceae bacterium]|nr:hypothetical protein [Chitinispirillaceae bacterium]